jgi:F-type H+-transporting ATPase subunit c
MDLSSAQVIGAGLAAIGVGAAATGVGNVFGSFLEGALRNPSAADGQQGRLFIGFAAAELLGLIAFAVAMIILYAPPAVAEAEVVAVEAAAVEAPVAVEAPATAPAE